MLVRATRDGLGTLGPRLAETDGIAEVYTVTGDWDFVAIVRVLAEERGGARSGTRWAVDPLDGTTNFTRAMPVVAVSVALVDGGLPVVGVVIAPWLGLEFTVERGRGAALNGERLPARGPGD